MMLKYPLPIADNFSTIAKVNVDNSKYNITDDTTTSVDMDGFVFMIYSGRWSSCFFLKNVVSNQT